MSGQKRGAISREECELKGQGRNGGILRPKLGKVGTYLCPDQDERWGLLEGWGGGQGGACGEGFFCSLNLNDVTTTCRSLSSTQQGTKCFACTYSVFPS